MACVGLDASSRMRPFVLERDDVLVTQKINVLEEPPPPFLFFRSLTTTEKIWILSSFHGRAIAQAVSRRLPTARWRGFASE
jgi:hypothetical protein